MQHGLEITTSQFLNLTSKELEIGKKQLEILGGKRYQFEVLMLVSSIRF